MKKKKNDSDKSLTKVQKIIVEECDKIKELLLEKNKSYGNSALKPIKIFSRVGAGEAIRVRIDDKLSRIAYGHEFKGDRTTVDLIGYLMLDRVRKRLKKSKKFFKKKK